MPKIDVCARFAPLFLIFVMLFAACGSSSTSTSSSNAQHGSGGNTPIAATATPGTVTVLMVAEAGGFNDDRLNHLAYLGYTKTKQQYGFTSTVLVTTKDGAIF